MKDKALLCAFVLTLSLFVLPAGQALAAVGDAAAPGASDAVGEVADDAPDSSSAVTTYRLYNPYTGEHLYTQSASERGSLVGIGWDDEGVGWVAPASGDEVYRLYNPHVAGGDHHYTMSPSERDALVTAGWRDEGVCWYSDTEKGVAVWRQYNPYATTGAHNFTQSAEENLNLVSHGWRHEGVGWYALDLGPEAPAGDFSGWAEVDGERFYGHGDGTFATGWETIDGTRYHFDAKGRLSTGVAIVDGQTHVFDADGRVSSGWRDIAGYRYYIEPSGVPKACGWWESGGERYYLDPASGAAKVGWAYVSDKLYYFDATGGMHRGWLDYGGKTYYFDPSSGVMVTGLLAIDGSERYFNADGSLNEAPGVAAMVSRAQGCSSATRWLILVDNTNNYLGIFSGSRGSWNLEAYWLCTTGAPSSPTVLGEYTITGRGYSFNGALTLPAYTCYYYTQFYGDYLIHSVEYYQNTFDVLDGRLGQNLSHGCVRLPIDQAKWVYDNIPNGTKLVSYR